jgi:two-component system OmpR family response regulator
MDGPRILVVDDDASILDALCDYLGRHGFSVRGASGGAEMDRALAGAPADLVVLDLMMPGEDGLSICRRLRPDGPPVLMLSAMGETTDRIVGLEIGADDYLAKPFEPRELLARVRAILRRRSGPAGEPAGKALVFAGWRLDLFERSLTDPEGRAVALTSGETALLKVLAERPQRVLSRDQLLELVQGPDAEAFDRAVDLQISRLRRKLEPGGGAGLIETIRGEGYRFTAQVRRQ